MIARVLAGLGRKVIVIEKGSHPRFAIGESSTPVADRILRDLCRRYGLSDLEPLTQYGTASKNSSIVVGPKRGFTYIDALSYEPASSSVSQHEMLVAASSDLASSDTHWLRSSVDQFFARSLTAAGIDLHEQTSIERLEFDRESMSWSVSTASELDSSHRTFVAGAIIDASGRNSPLASSLGINARSDHFQTVSGACFGHVRGWEPLENLARPEHVNLAKHPYPCDQAALHHVASDGWMWQLAFDNGVTSVGWCVAPQQLPVASESRDDWWNERLRLFEWAFRQGAKAKRIEPMADWGLIARMQFERERLAGNRWWMLPGAAGFVDPLHSSGIAHTMVSIERLAMAFEDLPLGMFPDESFSELYELSLRREIRWIDSQVAACYRSMSNFECFTLASMLYFVSAVHFERVRGNALPQASRSREPQAWPDFLSANDRELVEAVERARELILEASALQRSLTGLEREKLLADLRKVLAEVNHAGLLDPSVHPYYFHTAAPPEFSREMA